DLMVALESRLDRRGNERNTLEQIYPRQVWFDVKPAGGEAFDGTLRWTELRGYPAPTWGLDLTDWPPRQGGADPAIPKIAVSWNWARGPAAGGHAHPQDGGHVPRLRRRGDRHRRRPRRQGHHREHRVQAAERRNRAGPAAGRRLPGAAGLVPARQAGVGAA